MFDRQVVDVVEGLIRCEHDAADAFAKRGAHDRHTVRFADRDGPALHVNDVITAGGRSDRVGQVGQFLVEHLLERSIRCEKAVAHEYGLLSATDHFAIELPVVER